DLLGEEAGEQAGTGPDVRDRHTGLELAGGHDFLSPGVDLPALRLELAYELLHVEVLESLVDARSEERRVGKESRCAGEWYRAEDGIRDDLVTGVQTCALPI